MIQQLPQELADRIEYAAAVRREQIRSSKDQPVFFGTPYYVSAQGNDQNDGLTPDTAWKTLTKVDTFPFNPGDAVLLRRGDEFRGHIKACEGVTYSAYGDGPKPIFNTSPFDGAKVGQWIPTEVPHIYRYSEKMIDDIGCIVFDGGEYHGLKATIDFSKDENLTNETPFHSWRDLIEDLSFYHDLGGPHTKGYDENSTLYLKSTAGNPGERFSSIEFNSGHNGITVTCNDVHINNLNIRHCGNHGIGAVGFIKGLKVDWCEFEWIGGSMQGYSEKGSPVRFGNAIEIYGGCLDYIVENCYINQVYDAGITHQYSAVGTEDILMKDIIYKGNLIENCTFSIEYFNGRPEAPAHRNMVHVRMYDNIMRYSGYGFGKQRPWRSTTACHIKSWDHQNTAEDMIYEGNIMDCSGHALIHATCEEERSMPIIRRNIFIQNRGGKFAKLGTKLPAEFIYYTEEGINSQTYIGEDNEFYYKD